MSHKAFKNLKKRINKVFVLIISISAIFYSCNKKDDVPIQDSTIDDDGLWTYVIPESVDGDWEVENLENLGFSLPTIDLMMESLSKNDLHHYHSVLVVKNEKLVLEEYFSGYDRHNTSSLENGITHFTKDTLHFMASVSKSIMSVCFGIAIDKGVIESVDDKIHNYFPEYSDHFDEAKEQISIKNCLQMSSGLPWDESTYPYSDSRNDLNHMLYETDPFGFFLGRDLIFDPGTAFHYNSGNSNLLGEIVHEKMDLALLKVAEKYLFDPLGINDYWWWLLPNADSVTYASSGLYLRPRDLAKIGQLYLNGGLWGDQQIVSENWVNESITETIDMPLEMKQPFHSHSYGYQWWLEKYDSGNTFAYSARGHGNQYLIVIPQYDLVIVLTGGAYHISPLDSPIKWYEIVQDYILPAIK